MEKSGKHRYTLRDIQTGEIICADLTAGEVYRITGIPSQQVNKYWQRGTIRDSIWKVDLYEEGDEGIWTPELCMRWDCIRKMVLGGLKHGKGTYEEKIARWRNRASKKRSTELSRTEVCARYMQEAIKPQQDRKAEVNKDLEK